jgi:hypothetical protein
MKITIFQAAHSQIIISVLEGNFLQVVVTSAEVLRRAQLCPVAKTIHVEKNSEFCRASLTDFFLLLLTVGSHGSANRYEECEYFRALQRKYIDDNDMSFSRKFLILTAQWRHES